MVLMKRPSMSSRTRVSPSPSMAHIFSNFSNTQLARAKKRSSSSSLPKRASLSSAAYDEITVWRVVRETELHGDCWEATGFAYRSGKGYRGTKYRGKDWYVHKLMWHLLVGPTDLPIDHLCENKSCWNPRHLQPVTTRVNSLRTKTTLAAINSAKDKCPQGHRYTQSNIHRNTGNGGRACRACMDDRNAARRKSRDAR